MKKIKKTLIAYLILPLIPLISFAQIVAPVGVGGLRRTEFLILQVARILRVYILPLAFMLGLLFFFWGVAKYIRSAGTEKDEGKKIMVWGVVALFVMTSIWGLVFFLQMELLGTLPFNFQTIPTVIW